MNANETKYMKVMRNSPLLSKYLDTKTYDIFNYMTADIEISGKNVNIGGHVFEEVIMLKSFDRI
jgi:hypothetical protein